MWKQMSNGSLRYASEVQQHAYVNLQGEIIVIKKMCVFLFLKEGRQFFLAVECVYVFVCVYLLQFK